MTPDIAFNITEPAPGVLSVEELPYLLAGWCAILSGLAGMIIAIILRWRAAYRTPLAVAICCTGICILLGVWLIGLHYETRLDRAQSAATIRRTWFGHLASERRIAWRNAPVADIVVTKNTTRQLVLRFEDGSLCRLGLSTDRDGYDQAAARINTFLRGESLLK